MQWVFKIVDYYKKHNPTELEEEKPAPEVVKETEEVKGDAPEK